jgi:ABC-2 type transport system permease protein
MKRAYPWSFFLNHVLSGFYMTIFAYLTYYVVFDQALNTAFIQEVGTGDYISYVIIGGLLYSFSVSMLMIVSRSLITELREGTLEALLLTPSSRKGYFLGYVFQGLTQIGLEFFIILLMGFFFGLHLLSANFLSVLIVLISLIFSTFGLALVLGSLMLYFRDTYLTQNTLFNMMFLLCNITFPLEFLPKGVQWIGEIIPLTYGVDAFREAWMNNASVGDISILLLKTFGLGFIYLCLGSITIKKMERGVLEKHFG